MQASCCSASKNASQISAASGTVAQYTPLPDVTLLSGRVTRVLGQNPGSYTLAGSNVYLVGNGTERLLIDTGEGKTEFVALLRRVLDEQSAVLKAVLITHRHHDHIGGVDDVLRLSPGVPVYKHIPAAAEEFGDAEGDSPDSATAFLPLHDGDEFSVDGATLRAIATAGHTNDHFAFKLDEEDAIFTGDCVLGEGTAVFSDLYEYLHSLERLAAMKPAIVYPGHGPKLTDDATDRILTYIEHRQQRERQIVGALESASPKSMSVLELVKAIYPALADNVIPAACNNVTLHLRKLDKDGLARCDHEQWSVRKSSI